MSVMTAEIPEYARNTISSEKMIDRGTVLAGFLTSSPVNKKLIIIFSIIRTYIFKYS